MNRGKIPPKPSSNVVVGIGVSNVKSPLYCGSGRVSCTGTYRLQDSNSQYTTTVSEPKLTRILRGLGMATREIDKDTHVRTGSEQRLPCLRHGSNYGHRYPDLTHQIRRHGPNLGETRPTLTDTSSGRKIRGQSKRRTLGSEKDGL